MNTLPTTARRYLGELEAALTGVPAAQRAAILDDIRAHIADATEDGRNIDDTLAGLGAPATVAQEARDELGLARGAEPATAAARTLTWGAVALALLTSAFVAFILPTSLEFADQGSPGQPLTTETLLGQFGVGAAFLTLIPAALAVLPLVVPKQIRVLTAWIAAVATTVLVVVTGVDLGGFYAPVALMLWAAALVPAWIRRGGKVATAHAWRVVGAAAMLLPAVLVLGGLVTGTLQDPTPAFWIVAIVVLALGVLFALRVRFVDSLVALCGLVLMGIGVLDAGILILAFWWAGGIWFVAGFAALAARAPLGLARAAARMPGEK